MNRTHETVDELYFASGILRIEAQGYAYSNGGVKGAFGFYPHLKDEEGFPLFPDTQIRGNLQAAATWFANICPKEVESAGIDMKKLFGGEGKHTASKLRMTDLELTPESKDKWKKWGEEEGLERFQVKSRIRIQPETQTVAHNFLVDLELAFLDGLRLESEIYIGYFTNKERLDNTIRFIENALDFWPGFGAFRSRGFGRGKVTLRMEPCQQVTCPSFSRNGGEEAPCEDSVHHGNVDSARYENVAGTSALSFNYFIESLGHMRSKVPGTGSLQHIETLNYIPARQLRAWFIHTWHTVFKQWPNHDQVARIDFTPLYPGDASRNLLAYPAPMSILKFEDDSIDDVWERVPRDRAEEWEKSREEDKKGKAKSLSKDCFITDSDPIRVLEVQRRTRVRNKLDADFITKDDSLFVQEFIPKGTTFGTRICIRPLPEKSETGNKGSEVEEGSIAEGRTKKDSFMEKALFILRYVRPMINGTFFELIEPTSDPEDTNSSEKRSEHEHNDTRIHKNAVLPSENEKKSVKDRRDPYLVVQPLSDIQSIMKEKHPAQSVKIGYIQGFNTVLKRPERNRIVVLPSSIVMADDDNVPSEHLIPWKARVGVKEIQKLGKEPGKKTDKAPHAGESHRDDETPSDANAKETAALKISEGFDSKGYDYSISRAQAGLLRDFLNPNIAYEQIEHTIQHRKERYEKKEKLGRGEKEMLKLLGDLNKQLREQEGGSLTAMRLWVRQYLENFGVARWRQKEQAERGGMQ